MKPYIYKATVEGEIINVLSIISEDIVFKYGLNQKIIIGYFTNLEDINKGFIENLNFKSFFQKIISREVIKNAHFLEEGKKIYNGYVYIFDNRAIDKNNVSPSDILGAYQFENGLPIPESYQENIYYRLYTEVGLFQLEPAIETVLLNETLLLIIDN